MAPEPPAHCPFCGAQFSAAALLQDPEVAPIGMTLEDGEAHWNFFYFNHLRPDCGSTFTVRADELNCLLTEPAPPDIKTGEPGCEGRCTRVEDHEACLNDCHWAAYRRLLITMIDTRGPSAGLPAS